MVWCSNPGGGKRFSFHHTHEDWPWCPYNLLYNGYGGSVPEIKWLWHSMAWTTHPN
jgi:hypothetical protein